MQRRIGYRHAIGRLNWDSNIQKGSNMRFAVPACALIGIAFISTVTALGSADAAPANEAVRGKMLFLKCSACHSISAQAPVKIGPHLQGIVGRKAVAVAKFNYSPAMKKAKVTWNEATLDKWLQRPSSVVPGTSMVFAGMPKSEDRRALIAYLKKPS